MQQIANKTKRVSRLTLIAAGVLCAFSHQAVSQESSNNDVQDKQVEVVQIFGSRQVLETSTGSGFVVDNQQLEQFEFDDIHRVLQSVPGVYVREEDGYGLRPNIGLRGATTERSSKVALMEDGILIAPAPYAAPAAYFFPIVSRMTQVEVFKGPSAIAYGPNTIGGAINLVSRPIGEAGRGVVDLAGGQQGYAKAHGYYAHALAGFEFSVEGIHLTSDGFKDLPDNDDTGFDKDEVIGKIAYSPQNDPYKQRWEFKAGYAEEESNETYLGLTDEDFAASPYRRYAASQDDNLDWEHYQFQLSHYMELSPQTTVFTQVYRKEFDRDWDRLNGFDSPRSLSTILESPDTGLNALFMEVLRGERDSLTNAESLIFSLNDRAYYSQGIQSKLIWDGIWNDTEVSIESGLRIHQDQVERHHRSRFMRMISGNLESAGVADEVTIRNEDTVDAIAGYINGKIYLDNLHATFGVRVENIEGESLDFLAGTEQSNSDTVILPGAGLFYQLSPNIGLLAGINKGFVPTAPGQSENVDAEESWNYELGIRASLDQWRFEAVGFFNDYSNLVARCTFSSGCTGTLDEEFNGGEVDIYGLEATASGKFELSRGIQMPLSIAYTFTQSEFQTGFSSSFSQWGSVSKGDELPYQPENLFNLTVGLEGESWRVDLNIKYLDEMLEAAGSETDLEGVKTPSLTQLDLAGWYQLTPELKLYAKLDNVTDESEIVSRRPFGARPGKPRQFILGAKYTF